MHGEQDAIHYRENLRATSDLQRNELLRGLREELVEMNGGNESVGLSLNQVIRFFSKRDVTASVFDLMDHEMRGALEQTKWLNLLRCNIGG